MKGKGQPGAATVPGCVPDPRDTHPLTEQQHFPAQREPAAPRRETEINFAWR